MNSLTQKTKNTLNSLLLPVRKMYDWCLSWAEHPKGTWALGFIAVIESIFFPLPVDPLLIAMGTARPPKALKFALVASICSVLGGCIGYLIGQIFWEHTQELFLTYVISAEKMDLVFAKFKENAFFSIFLAGFTPIPYKVFTLSAGIAQISFSDFLLGSLIGRSMRFFLLGSLLYKFGAPIKIFIDKYFAQLTIGLGAAIVLGYMAYRLIAH